MWFKVLKPFGKSKVGDQLELKDDGQFQTLVDAGMLAVTEAPQQEVKEVDPNASYSVDTIVEQPKAKPGPKKKD